MLRPRLIALTIAAVTFATSASAADFAQPPGMSVPGHTIAQLSTEWWQWSMSIPRESNPIRDVSGGNCGIGQQGPVWFLAGGLGSSKVRRICTIPANTPVFFPVINMMYYPPKGDTNLTCRQARASAALNNDSALDLFVEFNGTPLTNVKRYRVAPDKCFDVFERIPVEQRPYAAYPSASDGYWVLLKPLRPGHYSLRFGGRYNRNSADYGQMVQDIEYELIVQ